MDQQKPDFQDLLKNIYKGQDKIAQLIEGLDEIPQQSLDDYYVKLQMIVKEDTSNKNHAYESITGEKKDIELENLFEKSSDATANKVPHKLLILGGAGVGKSTLMQYIAFQWGLDKLWNDKFDYVYRISLKTMLSPEWKTSSW